MILLANSIHRRAGVAILISGKRDFKITKATRDKDGHFRTSSQDGVVGRHCASLHNQKKVNHNFKTKNNQN